MSADGPANLGGAWARGCIEGARLPGSPWFAMQVLASAHAQQRHTRLLTRFRTRRLLLSRKTSPTCFPYQERLELVLASWLLRSGYTGMTKLHVRPRYEDANRRLWAPPRGEKFMLSASAASEVPYEVADVVDSLVLLVAAEADEQDGRPKPASVTQSADGAEDTQDSLPSAQVRLEASLQVLGETFARTHFPAVERRPHLLEPPFLTRTAAMRLRAGLRAQIGAMVRAELSSAAAAAAEAAADAAASPLAVASRQAFAERAKEYGAHVAALASEALAAEVESRTRGAPLASRAFPPQDGAPATATDGPQLDSAQLVGAQRVVSRAALGDGVASLLELRGAELDMRLLEPLHAAAIALPSGLRRLAWRTVLLRSAAAAARANGGLIADAAELVRRTSARMERNLSLSGARSVAEAPARSVLRAAVRSAFGSPLLWAGLAGGGRADSTGGAIDGATHHGAGRCGNASASAAAGAAPLSAQAGGGRAEQQSAEHTAARARAEWQEQERQERAVAALHARALAIVSADSFAGPDPLDAHALDGGAFAPQPLAAEGVPAALLAGGAPPLAFAWRHVSEAEARAELPALVAMLRELRSERALGGLGAAASGEQVLMAVSAAQPVLFADLVWMAMRSADAPARQNAGARSRDQAEPSAVRTSEQAAALLARTIAAEWLLRGFCSTLPAETAAWAWDQCMLRARADGGADWAFLLHVAQVLLIGRAAEMTEARAAHVGWQGLHALLRQPQPEWTPARLRLACFPGLNAGHNGGSSGEGGILRAELGLGIPRLWLDRAAEQRSATEQQEPARGGSAAEHAASEQALGKTSTIVG